MEDSAHNRVVRRSPVALARAVADQIVILDTHTEQYYVLNRVGTEVWQLLDGSRDIEAIVTALRTRYDVPEEILRADVTELLEDLKARGLIVE